MYILTVKTVLKFISATGRALKLIIILLSFDSDVRQVCARDIISVVRRQHNNDTIFILYIILLLLLLTVELLSRACTTQYLDICCACRSCSPRIDRVKNYYLEINSLRMIRITLIAMRLQLIQ